MFPAHAQNEHELAPVQPSADSIRWGFGALAGAAYGAMAEFYPAATAKEGASFGMALEALTHEGALPALGLAAEAGESLGERTGEITSYIVFGVTTELVRSLVRRLL